MTKKYSTSLQSRPLSMSLYVMAFDTVDMGSSELYVVAFNYGNVRRRLRTLRISMSTSYHDI